MASQQNLVSKEDLYRRYHDKQISEEQLIQEISRIDNEHLPRENWLFRMFVALFFPSLRRKLH
jgi:hypothetical protein